MEMYLSYYLHSVGFNYENGKIALSFDGSDELKSATANTALSSPSSLTITTVAKNTLASSNGQYFKTSNSITAFNIAQNSTTNKKCVGIAPYQLNSINTNTNLAQRILIFYKDGSTRSLALNGVLQDTLTQFDDRPLQDNLSQFDIDLFKTVLVSLIIDLFKTVLVS